MILEYPACDFTVSISTDAYCTVSRTGTSTAYCLQYRCCYSLVNIRFNPGRANMSNNFLFLNSVHAELQPVASRLADCCHCCSWRP